MNASSLPLPPELREFLQTKMSTGQYASENDVVCEALTFLRERDQARAARLTELRRDIQIGLEQLDRGDSKPFNPHEIKAEVRRRLANDNPNR